MFYESLHLAYTIDALNCTFAIEYLSLLVVCNFVQYITMNYIKSNAWIAFPIVFIDLLPPWNTMPLLSYTPRQYLLSGPMIVSNVQSSCQPFANFAIQCHRQNLSKLPTILEIMHFMYFDYRWLSSAFNIYLTTINA